MARAAVKKTPRPARRPKAITTVEPDYLLRLMDDAGGLPAASMLGVAPTTLYRAKRLHAVTQPLELAARHLWYEKGYGATEQGDTPPAPRTAHLGKAVPSPASEGVTVILVQVPKGKSEDILQKTVEALGGTVIIQS